MNINYSFFLIIKILGFKAQKKSRLRESFELINTNTSLKKNRQFYFRNFQFRKYYKNSEIFQLLLKILQFFIS